MAGIQKATGYIRGGCSPLGMKKAYPTVFDASAQGAGLYLRQRGAARPAGAGGAAALAGLCGASFAAITQGTAAGHAL